MGIRVIEAEKTGIAGSVLGVSIMKYVRLHRFGIPS